MNLLPHRLRATLAATLFATVAFSAAASAGCGSCCCRAATYAVPVVQTYEQVDVTPRYIVNQGPVYSGPAITVPVLTYSESLSAHGHPYVRGTRGYYVRGYGDVYDGGPYADPLSHRRPYYHHRHHRHHHSRVHGADGRALDVPVRPGVSVVRARAEVRYLSPERMEIKLQRDQKPRKKHRDSQD
jgi:hypothetical protein